MTKISQLIVGVLKWLISGILLSRLCVNLSVSIAGDLLGQAGNTWYCVNWLTAWDALGQER